MSFLNKHKTEAAVNTAPAGDGLTGTAEDVDAVMKKYDRESNVRVWEGKPKTVIRFLMAAFSLFCIYLTLVDKSLPEVRLTLFLAMIIFIGFLNYPVKKGHVRVNYIPWYDVVLMVAGAGPFLYFAANAQKILLTSYSVISKDPFMLALAIVAILVLVELCRRCVGLPILFVVGALLIYTFANVRFGKVVYDLFYTTNGVMNTPINVCQKYIVVFIIFGAFLERTSISAFFIDLANCVAGSSCGGPAKVAVISSALCGMVSGSSVGNTVTTGSVTIPMMIKTGYKPDFAGAVEAAASTGGQIMPPIMGAAAFLMAEMVGVQYGEIAMRAIFPALLYFTGIFITVHLEAKRLGLKGIPKDELPKFGPLFVRQGYLLIPLVALVAMVMMGYTMSRAAIIATALAILVSMPNKETRMNPTRFINALEAGGKNTLSVAVACGVAGIIAGVVTMTGLGQLLISAIVGVAGDRVIVALFLTMLTCIVLGMGVPTTANYIIMATTCAPILVNGMGINKIAANMFVFYFGIVADITPPVALAAYAGSAIAKSNPMKTALNASRLAIAAFIVPYIFAFNPAMLFIDTGVLGVVTIIVTSLIGLFGVAAGLEGYMFANLNVIERLLSIVGGLCLIIPGTVTDIVGIVLVGISAALQIMKKKKAAVA